jgi:hypothetical protein
MDYVLSKYNIISECKLAYPLRELIIYYLKIYQKMDHKKYHDQMLYEYTHRVFYLKSVHHAGYVTFFYAECKYNF